MENQVSHLNSSLEAMVAAIKLLAMTKRARSSLVEAEGMAAAALADVLKLGPPHQNPEPCQIKSISSKYPTYIRTDSGEMQDISDAEDRVVAESIDKSDVELLYDALLDSADERIAALTRVLHAPDDNPQEKAAARAELAHSKAYPELPRRGGTDPEVGGLDELDGKPCGTVRDETVVPREEECVLNLYQTLLTREGSEKRERLQMDVPIGEDTVDKEAMRIELHVQKTYRNLLLKRKADLDTRMEVVWQLLEFYDHAYDLSERKQVLASMMDAAKSVHTLDVEMPAMANNLNTPRLVQLPGKKDLPKNRSLIPIVTLETFDDILTGVYDSPFVTTAEKLFVLIELITTRNRLKQMKTQHRVRTPEAPQGSYPIMVDDNSDEEDTSNAADDEKTSIDDGDADGVDDDFMLMVDKAALPGNSVSLHSKVELIKLSVGQTQAESTDPEEESRPSVAESPLHLDKEHDNTHCHTENAMPTVREAIGERCSIEKQARSPDKIPEPTSPKDMEK